MRLPFILGLVPLATVHAAISTISAYGNKFFYENGTRKSLLNVLASGVP